MANLTRMLRQLRAQREVTKKRLKHLGAVIAAFEKMMGRGREARRTRRARRKLSAAARRKISAAQRARWARSRQQEAA